jgi:hypothetical protein
MDIDDDIPNPAAFEGFGALGDKLPNLGQFTVVETLSRYFVQLPKIFFTTAFLRPDGIG